MSGAFHTRGNYAPVVEELTTGGLSVTGSLPADLCGTYVRNGPNPVSGDARFWFSGEGMLHGVALRNGTAAWYRNRWVRTPWLHDPALPKIEDGTPRLDRSLANTSVVRFAGRTLALEENSLPYEVDADLATIGPWDMNGCLNTAMTAHPKLCPTTGELHFIGYAAQAPFLVYHVADSSGALVCTSPIEVPGPTMIHEMGLTERHVVLFDLPVVMQRMTRRQPSFAWSDTYGARIGIMPRRGSSGDVVWVDIEPCYIFHVANCWERSDGTVVIDAARYPELWREGSTRFAPPSVLWRYEVDPVRRTVRETQLDDRTVEFPRIDDRLNGSCARWTHAIGSNDVMANAIVRYDLARNGESTVFDFGPGRVPGEAVVVPRAGSVEELDSWLIAFVYDAARNSSDLVVLAADDVAAGPVATVHLPQRVPFGFHGTWIDGAEQSAAIAPALT